MVSVAPSDKVKAYFSKYFLHEEYGFYHNLYEDERLPSEFRDLEELAYKLPEMNACGETRKAVGGLSAVPLIDDLIEPLSYNQAFKLFSIVSFLTNSYLFSEKTVVDILPEPLSTVLYSVTKKLGTRAIMSFTCCCFWNTQIKDSKAPVEIDNLKVRLTFTGDSQEEWFGLIIVANDIIAMKILKNLITAQEELEEDNSEKVAEQLLQILPHLSNLSYPDFFSQIYLELMTKTLNINYEKVKPEFFFNELRFFFKGYQGFSSGLRFQGVTEYEKEGPKFAGLSAGQSPFYQTFHNALGNFHGKLLYKLAKT